MYQTCEKLRRIEAEGYSYSDDELFEEFLDRVERLERGVRDYE